MKNKEERSLDLFFSAIDGMKAIDVVALDVRALTSVADTYIFCSGSSNRQVMAIADHIKREMKKSGIRPLAMEGKKEGHWVLLDYGDVVVHVFYEPVRAFYDLEGLWADAIPLLP